MKDRRLVEDRIDYSYLEHALERLHSRDMSQFDRISVEEEICLAHLRDKAARAKIILDSGKAKNEEEICKLKRTIQVGREALDKLITSNYRLVLHMARSCLPILDEMTQTEFANGINISLPDLIQAGYIGLIEAAYKFDQKRGIKFSTYACFLILQRISETISFNSGLEHSRKDYRHVLMEQDAADALTRKFGRTPTLEEISEQSGLGKRRLTNISSLIHNFALLSLNAKPRSHETDNAQLYETLASDLFSATDEQALHNVFTEQLRSSIIKEIQSLIQLGKLNSITGEVLLFYFGFSDGVPKTLEETSIKFGQKSRQLIQIWINKACLHLSKSAELKMFLDSL